MEKLNIFHRHKVVHYGNTAAQILSSISSRKKLINIGHILHNLTLYGINKADNGIP